MEIREDEVAESGGAAAADGEETAPRVPRRPKKKGDKNKEKSVLGKAGDAVKATFNVFMAASTVASVALAVEAVWQLHGTQLTLSNAVPTLAKLLPLTGIGAFGAAQLVGLMARVVRVVVTLPVMLSGTWVILQNAPKVGRVGCALSSAVACLCVVSGCCVLYVPHRCPSNVYHRHRFLGRGFPERNIVMPWPSSAPLLYLPQNGFGRASIFLAFSRPPPHPAATKQQQHHPISSLPRVLLPAERHTA